MTYRRTAAIAACALALIVSGCTVEISGTPTAGERGPQVPVVVNVDTDDVRKELAGTEQQVNDYWSSGAADQAKDVAPKPGNTDDAPADDATGAVQQPTTGQVSATAGVGLPDSSEGAKFPTTGLSGRTQGRLYMLFPGNVPAVCSATVVNSLTRDLIATAGHCVFRNETGEMAVGISFVPADSNNGKDAPFGVWDASDIFVSPEFTKNAKADSSGSPSGSGWRYDFAFVRLKPDSSGARIQDKVGGQGIAFGTAAKDLTVIGYPTADPFDGLSERYCSSSKWTTGYADGYQIPCKMTSGCSGGGWLTRYDPKAGAGYLVAVTSVGSNRTLASVRLGRVALDLFKQAGGMT